MIVRPAYLVFAALILAGCPTGTPSECLAGEVAESGYCGDDGTDCAALAELSEGCMGSHTEQPCTSGGVTFVRVGGDDAATTFFDEDGTIAAVRLVGEGTGECDDAWFGLDLSDCAAAGDEERVPCNSTWE